MSAPKHRRSMPPATNDEIFRAMHENDLKEGVVELGSSTSEQGGLFESIRTRITHGEVLKFTFDEAVKRRSLLESWDDDLPRKVEPSVFNADVEKIRQLSGKEAEAFDHEVCNARMETRCHKTGGTLVSQERGSGFGREVFGFAYEAYSGKWSMTNERGLHAHCASNLRYKVDRKKHEILSGFIFQLGSIDTPVMTPSGYAYNTPDVMKKAFEDLWSWKMFIPIANIKVAPRKYLWSHLFTPEYAEQICQEMQDEAAKFRK